MTFTPACSSPTLNGTPDPRHPQQLYLFTFSLSPREGWSNHSTNTRNSPRISFHPEARKRHTYPEGLSTLITVTIATTAPSIWKALRSWTSAVPKYLIPQTAPRNISMAWRSSGATNEALIENMSRNGLITSDRVKKAMLGVRVFPFTASRTRAIQSQRLTCHRLTVDIMLQQPHTKTPRNRSGTLPPLALHTCTPMLASPCLTI